MVISIVPGLHARFKMVKNVLLIVDTQNIGNNVKHKFGPDAKLDYAAYVNKSVGDDILFKAIAYGSHFNRRAAKFISLLRNCGFDPRFKELHAKKDRESGEETPVYIDSTVDIVIDVMELVNLGKVDRVILGTSDPQFIRLITEVKRKGVDIEVHSCRTPMQLREASTKHVELTDEYLWQQPAE